MTRLRSGFLDQESEDFMDSISAAMRSRAGRVRNLQASFAGPIGLDLIYANMPDVCNRGKFSLLNFSRDTFE